MITLLISDENKVPSVTSYHNAKARKHGTVSYFFGYGVNNDCHIVDPAFIENCIADDKKLFFMPKFLEMVEMNPNRRNKLLYKTKQLLKKNKKESIDDIQFNSMQRMVVEVTNNKGKNQML